jgi:hypothetical protein
MSRKNRLLNFSHAIIMQLNQIRKSSPELNKKKLFQLLRFADFILVKMLNTKQMKN